MRVCERALLSGRRIDTIMDMDTLLVLDQGKLVEQGPPSELTASPGYFGRMVQAARQAVAAAHGHFDGGQ